MRSLLVRAVILVLLGGCVVVRPPRFEERPRWSLAAPAHYAAACAEADAFIRKSGKTGLGLSVRVRSSSDCTFTVTASRIVFGRRVFASGAAGPVALPGRSQLYVWLPIRFDNDAMWNAGHDDATIELDVAVAAAPTATWKFGVHQR